MSGVLVTITGPTGSGKTTLAQRLSDELGMRELVSTTTREPRDGEIKGADYHFMGRAEFEAELDRFVEHVEYGGSLYGLTKLEVLGVKQADSVVVVDPNGRDQLRVFCAEHRIPVVHLYIGAPTGVLVDRLIERHNLELFSIIDQNDVAAEDGALYEAEGVAANAALQLTEETRKRIFAALSETRLWADRHGYDLFRPSYADFDDMDEVTAAVEQAVKLKKGLRE